MALVVNFDWNTFFQYLWPPSALQNPLIAHGVVITIFMAIAAQTLGVIIGLVTGLGQSSKVAPVKAICQAYIVYFRGTPLLVQLSLLYFGTSAIGLYRFPDLRIGDFDFPGIVQAGILGLGVNEGSYMAEIIRAGILGIDMGQWEAARAIGMRNTQALRWIILPQAARIILPPLGNEFNGMIKSTTLVVNIGGIELFNAYEQINAVIFKPFELFLAVSFYYLAMTMIWSVIQQRLERRMGRYARAASIRQPGTLRRMLSFRTR